MDYLDGDKMVDYLIDVMGLLHRWFAQKKRWQFCRQQAQQAAQQQEQLAQLQEAEIANKVAPLLKAQQQG